MMLVGLLVGLASGQDYAFPTSPDDRPHWYPTAYKDHGGVDWDCGTITYGGHNGSDFGGGSFAGMDEGRDVTAAAPGTVIVVHDGEFDRCTTGDCAGGYGFGNYVQLAHADGRTTLYGHLKQFSPLVAVGDDVSCGDKLGEMGSSGYSTGPHLHFEVRGAGGVAEDPFDGPCSGPPTYWTDQGVYGELPGDVCDEPEPCVPEAELSCGDVVVGRNDDPGSTSATWRYGCDDFVYSGPERSFTVRTDRDEPVALRLEGLSADLDLVALASDACDGTGCVASSSSPDSSDEALVFDAVAGEPVTVVIDGWEGAVSAFTLTVDCDGGLNTGSGPTADTGASGTEPTPTEPDTDTGDPTGSGSDPTPEGELDEVGTLTPSPPPRPGGCGCDGATAMGGRGALLLWSMVLWMRRRG